MVGTLPVVAVPGGAPVAGSTGSGKTSSVRLVVAEAAARSQPDAAQLQTHLRAQAERFVRFDHARGSVTLDYPALAAVVADIVTVHAASLRAVATQLGHDCTVLAAEVGRVRAERAALWALVKAQTRNARDLRGRAAHWRQRGAQAQAATVRREREIRQALGVPEDDGPTRAVAALVADLRVDRDEAVRESDVREQEIIALGAALERAETELADAQARLAELGAAERGAA